MKQRAVELIKRPVTGDPRQLTPGWAAGMPIRAAVAAAEPAIGGAIRIGTDVRLEVGSALASSGQDKQGRWRARHLGAFVGSLLPGHAERFVNEPGKGLGRFGAFATRRVELTGHLAGDAKPIVPPSPTPELSVS
jgi:hypothetical protein